MTPTKDKKRLRVNIPIAGKSELVTHRTKHMEDKSHQCNHCDKSFIRIGDFKRHVMTHTGEKPYKCNQCDKAFSQKSHLTVHLKIHTGEKPYKCSQCGKGFPQKNELKRHLRVHTGEKPYHCPHCQKSFSFQSNLKDHVRKHTGETKAKPYQCKICDKAFSLNTELIAHLRTHTGEKPFICTKCNKGFALKCNLVCHERIHTGEKPYQCDHCEKSFADHSTLKRHALIHSGNKSYECSHCEMAFTQNVNLIRHLKTHTGEKPYQCTQCDKNFITNNELKIHSRQHTGIRPYQCSYCGNTYRDNSSLILHQKIHTAEKPHKCTYCAKAFITRNHLKRHMNTHTFMKKTYPCSQCDSMFLQNDHLKTHMRMHTDSQKSIHINHLKTDTGSPGVWLGSVKQCHNKTTDYTSNQKPEPECNNILDKISTSDQLSIPLFCDDHTEVLLWFQQHKLLKSVVSCDSCFNLIDFSETSRSRDGFEWTCQTKSCLKYQHSENIRLGSFFSNSRVTLPDWFDVMFLWSENVKAKVTSNLVHIDHAQIVDCYASFRKICEVYFMKNPIKLGGPGITIEIDVARFSGNSKNKQSKPPIVVLGIVDSNSSPLQGYMEIIGSSDAATLLPIILKVVEPGSIVYTKESEEYQQIQGLTEKGTIVNHTVNFLEIITTEDVQNMESFWDRHNSNLSEIHGYSKTYISSYLQELMWRDRYYDDSFKGLCQHIAAQYPL